ncbi:hypothetical protein MKW98_001885 [Papaver atlanticum]|uniref:Calcium-transporting ATPase n=1 Tax=Papaver atlanticum TaxID=357466 RepID=A0AAD4T4K0_9MAGN|nr:hypothetical protein MKW98_001885 [Papaver atlanticum]
MPFTNPSSSSSSSHEYFERPILSKPHKRWRCAFTVIYSSRVFLSLAKKIISIKETPFFVGVSRSPSYTALDIISTEQDGDNSGQKVSFSIVGHKKLIDTFGGVHGVVNKLQTDVNNGICGGDIDISRRRESFGTNTYKRPALKGFFHYLMEPFKDTIILILLACAALSIGFGMKENGVKEGWYDGVSIFVAVFLVVGVSGVSNFRQSRQFNKLSMVSNNIQIAVIRDGRRHTMSIFDIVVGDVICLKIGDQIPADGLFLSGYSLQVDESSMTGETEPLEINVSRNPFLLSGCKVVDGYGYMIATSVGMDTAWGEMMSSVSSDSSERTPLQDRLDKLNSYIGKVGLTVAFLVLVVLSTRYFTGNTLNKLGQREFNGSKTKFNDVMNAVVRIISDAVTIVVVAIPEGLPLAVTLTLAYSMKRMMADQAMVPKLASCETMGSATTICTDKTVTLTSKPNEDEKASPAVSFGILELFYQGVGLNTTGSIYAPTSGMTPEISGSPTEKALLSWAVSNLGMDMEELKRSCTVLHVVAFNSEKKRSGISLKKKNSNIVHVHWKGAEEMILAMCSSYYRSTGVIQVMGEGERMKLEEIIKNMADQSLRCIAFAYDQFQEEDLQKNDGEEAGRKLKEDGLTLLGLVGLKDPCRPSVRQAVEACKNAGVSIKMITGDNIFTARAIATECGILDPYDPNLNNGAVVEGVEFRNYTVGERMEKVDRISVMARSSPFDKLLMVQCLKQKGHVVAVTGDGTNDAPALKEADVGLSMGIQGTEVAKESSDIVILDDNFATVVTVLRWGRCVYTNIQKFIQFQLTVNIAELVINFIAAASAGEVPLTTVQLLWLMKKPPVGRNQPLITNVMWRNLVAQALYQIFVLLILQFKGNVIFGVNEDVKNTLIFNTFVLCQVFNEFNARKLEKKNVFEGILKNKLFLGIIGITIVLQVVMVEFLKKFADTERLNWGQWGACIGIATISWPLCWVVKCIPVPEKPLFDLLKR